LAGREYRFVYITTPTDGHKALCLTAIEHGKPLVIEKPIALAAAEAHQIYAAAKRAKLIVMVGLKFRFYEMAQKARADPLAFSGFGASYG
jgi:predicted dehydrogenase